MHTVDTELSRVHIDRPRRGRPKNPKADKIRGQLEATILDMDYCTGRLIRWTNKLAAARAKRKRLERALALAIAAAS